jgi:hypothetical protein
MDHGVPDPGRAAGRGRLDGDQAAAGRPTIASAAIPQPASRLSLAATTAPSGASAISTPWGWIAPGMWIGSRSQVARSSGAALTRHLAW